MEIGCCDEFFKDSRNRKTLGDDGKRQNKA